MRTPLLFAILLTFSLAGCLRSGDFGAFVVSEATKYGGRTKTNASLPKLDARWTVKRDDNGFQASVTAASFTSIDTFMHQAFGTPKVSVDGTGTLTGQPARVWGAVDIGVAIQLNGRLDGAEIICVRGMRDMGEIFKKIDGRQ